LVFLQTDDVLKPGFGTVAEGQDACPELQKNFNGQELSYIRNIGREAASKDWTNRRAARLRLRSGRRPRSNKLAEHLQPTGRRQRPDVIVGELV
jgi:hypothetical protein